MLWVYRRVAPGRGEDMDGSGFDDLVTQVIGKQKSEHDLRSKKRKNVPPSAQKPNRITRSVVFTHIRSRKKWEANVNKEKQQGGKRPRCKNVKKK